MKQEIVTFLHSIDKDIFNLSKYIYDNPESSFHEYKCCSYLINIFKKYNFNVIENYINIPTAFYAQYGNGHPKICFICEYDAVENGNHITGHNLISSISTGAALSLSRVIDKSHGSVIVIGCPGEFIGSSKVTMAKQGVFNDIDIVLMAHPDVITAESGTSMALLPLKIVYKGEMGLRYRSLGSYSPLDACLFTFNTINMLSKGLKHDNGIDGVIVKGGTSPSLLPSECESRFYLRGSKMCYVIELEKKLRELVKTVGNLMEIHSEASIYELPYEELITNTTLSRIFSHNLKETGIIEIESAKDTLSSLSLGTVSHLVPCIHPYISIVEDDSIKYSSGEFAMATISRFAQDRVMKTAQALALTALDIIEKEHLLQDIKLEFHKQFNNN